MGWQRIGKLILANIKLWYPQDDRRRAQIATRPQQCGVHKECILGAQHAMCSMYMTEDVQFWLQPDIGFQQLWASCVV